VRCLAIEVLSRVSHHESDKRYEEFMEYARRVFRLNRTRRQPKGGSRGSGKRGYGKGVTSDCLDGIGDERKLHLIHGRPGTRVILPTRGYLITRLRRGAGRAAFSQLATRLFDREVCS
jgi:hypothetical protein